jgi:hypothetical protein
MSLVLTLLILAGYRSPFKYFGKVYIPTISYMYLERFVVHVMGLAIPVPYLEGRRITEL